MDILVSYLDGSILFTDQIGLRKTWVLFERINEKITLWFIQKQGEKFQVATSKNSRLWVSLYQYLSRVGRFQISIDCMKQVFLLAKAFLGSLLVANC